MSTKMWVTIFSFFIIAPSWGQSCDKTRTPISLDQVIQENWPIDQAIIKAATKRSPAMEKAIEIISDDKAPSKNEK